MSSDHRFDAAIVGAGIVGLAHAYVLSQRGLNVAVFERGAKAMGASVRNFGMIWPIGQPPGEPRDLALRSRELWLRMLNESGIWHQRTGSLHLAYAPDEMAVLEEFAHKGAGCGYETEVVSASRIAEISPVVKTGGLQGGLWSESELCVFPRQVVSELARYLEERCGVTFHWSTAVRSVETGRLTTSSDVFAADRIFLCTGDDFETLYPERFASSGLTRCKLQMLRAQPRDGRFKIGAHLCAGLTLGHYSNFKVCEKLEPLMARFKAELPEYMEWGIHLLVSQHEDGLLTIGDSHEYGLAPTPFLREHIDRLILDYLDTFLPVSELEIVERWYGVYGKHPSKSYLVEEIEPGVSLATGVGGAGMTLSFGLAEKSVASIGLASVS